MFILGPYSLPTSFPWRFRSLPFYFSQATICRFSRASPSPPSSDQERSPLPKSLPLLLLPFLSSVDFHFWPASEEEEEEDGKLGQAARYTHKAKRPAGRRRRRGDGGGPRKKGKTPPWKRRRAACPGPPQSCSKTGSPLTWWDSVASWFSRFWWRIHRCSTTTTTTTTVVSPLSAFGRRPEPRSPSLRLPANTQRKDRSALPPSLPPSLRFAVKVIRRRRRK